MKHIDPVYKLHGKWHFYDETWSDSFGPYDTEKEARVELKKYAKHLDARSEMMRREGENEHRNYGRRGEVPSH